MKLGKDTPTTVAKRNLVQQKSIREELIYELMNSTLDQIKLTTEEDNVLTNLCGSSK